MGTDIHIMVEVEDPETKQWKVIHRPHIKCNVCGGQGVTSDALCQGCHRVRHDHANDKCLFEPTTWDPFLCFQCHGNRTYSPKWYDSRSYTLFGLLAGVRGTWASALKDPSGLPRDVTPEVAREAEWGVPGDMHSHTWYFLSELLPRQQFYHEWPTFGDVLRELCHYSRNGGKDVRLLMWFDS